MEPSFLHADSEDSDRTGRKISRINLKVSDRRKRKSELCNHMYHGTKKRWATNKIWLPTIAMLLSVKTLKLKMGKINQGCLFTTKHLSAPLFLAWDHIKLSSLPSKRHLIGKKLIEKSRECHNHKPRWYQYTALLLDLSQGTVQSTLHHFGLVKHTIM